MGRVDEAIRRAAEGRGGEAGSDVDVLAHEPFPGEAPEPKPPVAAATAVAAPVQKRIETRPDPGEAPQIPNTEWPIFQSSLGRVAGKIVVDQHMAPGSREQYRRLAAALHHAQAASGVKVVMIASAAAAEGKSLTAANLALTLSESYDRSVLLIDADLRRPTLHTVFQISGSPGLSEGLAADGGGHLPVHRVSKNLTVLPAGQPSSDPMAGLTSARMRHLIEEARGEFGWVIIDTPPVGLLADANLLGAMADGTILVVRAGQTSYGLVQRAVETIGRSRLLGVVLNGATARARSYGYDYYNSYHMPTPPSDTAQ